MVRKKKINENAITFMDDRSTPALKSKASTSHQKHHHQKLFTSDSLLQSVTRSTEKTSKKNCNMGSNGKTVDRYENARRSIVKNGAVRHPINAKKEIQEDSDTPGSSSKFISKSSKKTQKTAIKNKFFLFLMIFMWMFTTGCAMETPSKLLLDALSLISPKRPAPSQPSPPEKRARKRLPIVDHQFNFDDTMIMDRKYYEEIMSEEKFAEDIQKASSSSQQIPSNGLNFDDVDDYIQELQTKTAQLYYLFDADCTNEDDKFNSIFYFGVTTQTLRRRYQSHYNQIRTGNTRKYDKFHGPDKISNIGISSVYNGKLSICLLIEEMLIKNGKSLGLDIVNMVHNAHTTRHPSKHTDILRRLVQHGVTAAGIQEFIDGLQSKHVHVYFLFDATCTTAESKYKSIFYFGASQNIQDRLVDHKNNSEKVNAEKWEKFRGPNKLENIGICSIYEGELSLCLMIEQMLINHGTLLNLRIVNINHTTKDIDKSSDTALLKRLIYRAIMIGDVFTTIDLTCSEERKLQMREQLNLRRSTELGAAKLKSSLLESRRGRILKSMQDNDEVVIPRRNAFRLFTMGYTDRYNVKLKGIKQISQYWHGLSEAEEEYWQNQADKDAERYAKDMNGFKLFQDDYAEVYEIVLETEAAIRDYWRQLSDEQQQFWITKANGEEQSTTTSSIRY